MVGELDVFAGFAEAEKSEKAGGVARFGVLKKIEKRFLIKFEPTISLFELFL